MSKLGTQRAVKERVLAMLTKIKLDREEEKLVEDLPPYNQYVASLHYRIRLLHMGLVILTLTGATLWAVALYEKRALFDKLSEKEVYLVPGTIPNILRIRANTLSDALVYEFADWFIDNLGNINFEEATYKINTLAGYMSSDLKTRFLTEMRPKIDLWTGRRVDQRFAFDPIKKFERTTEGRTTRFTVETWGTVRKSVEGRDLPSYREKVTLTFQTRPVSSEKTWFFEVIALERKTDQEIQDQNLKSL